MHRVGWKQSNGECVFKKKLGTCITLTYLNSKGKIKGGGTPHPQSILDKNSPIGIGLNRDIA